MIEPYTLLCMQVPTKVVRPGLSESEARKIIRDNLKHDLDLLDDALGFRAGPTKLALFPEFFLMGYPTTHSTKEWLKNACINIPGEETDKMGEKAKQYGIYVAGNCYATYEDWPERYDNTSFIIDPKGKVMHIHRRIITSYGYSPHDILDDFLEKYGEKELFTVSDTPLGKLAIFPCGESLVPEVARCFALNGAEVILHPMGGGIPPDGMFQICCRARAIENMVYFATAASALLTPSFPAGGSTIYDYQGRILARAMEGPVEAFVRAPIDITHLRKLRRSTNPLSRLRLEAFAPFYQKNTIWPPNRFLTKPMKDLKDIDTSQKMALENMLKRGILTPP